MTPKLTPAQVEADSRLAIPPFRAIGRCVQDATGSRVLVCSEDTECALRFSEDAVDASPWFMCPNCNRLGKRMVEASHEQCGIIEDRLTMLVGKRTRGEPMTPGQWRELESLERREKNQPPSLTPR